jgi:hypothetical protein
MSRKSDSEKAGSKRHTAETKGSEKVELNSKSTDLEKGKSTSQTPEKPALAKVESNSRKRASRFNSPSVIIAIIGTIGTIIAAFLYNFDKFPLAPDPTPTFMPTATLVPSATLTPTHIPTSTFTPGPTFTPLPISCKTGFFACVFTQADTGRTFEFKSDSSATLTVDDQAAECAFTTEFGVKLTYEVTQAGTNASWGVQWKDTVGYFDASTFTNFTFAVRGKEGDEEFLIGMKDVTGSEVTLESKSYVKVTPTEWQIVTIPLSRFTHKGTTINPSALDNVAFSFDERQGSGSICMDDIAFVQ